MADRIKTKGNLTPVRYWEDRTVLKFYRGELQLAQNFPSHEEALEDIVKSDNHHQKTCQENARWYVANGREIPEQFRYPSWTWRLATEDDINA
jgi:hypothetical protein